jgi:hypothetical protein
MATHNTPRPAAVRILAITALVLPTVLYIVSLAMTLESIYNPSFALSHPATTDGTVYKWTYKASPFYRCPTAHGQYVDESQPFVQKCTRVSALGSSGMRACNATNPGDEHICQKVVISAELFVAGASLIGIALLFSFVVIALGYKTAAATTTGGVYTVVHSDKDHESTTAGATSACEAPTSTPTSNQPPLSVLLNPLLRSFTTLLAILSACCVVLAQIVGVDGLVNSLQPTSSQLPNYQTRWYMGSAALVYPSVGYLAALLGAFIAWAGSGTA